jgi:hypothetical protein
MKTKTTTTFRALIRDATTFTEMLDILMQQGGLTRGRAILLSRKLKPRLYDMWMSRRVRTDDGRKRDSSVVQTL